VALKAKPTRGSKFSGWSGACKGIRSCKITANADVELTAKFVLRPCIVPNLVGKTLKAAKLAVKRAFCSVGKVRTSAPSKARKGTVASQQPKHGRHVKQHTRVALVVSGG
jgi:hypothetical protein